MSPILAVGGVGDDAAVVMVARVRSLVPQLCMASVTPAEDHVAMLETVNPGGAEVA